MRAPELSCRIAVPQALPFSVKVNYLMHVNPSAYVRWGKRLTDVVLAMCGIMVTAPIFAACALAVKLDSRGPVLFRQRRVGKNLRPFQIVKFRTMLQDTEERGPSITASDDKRITAVGKFLRQVQA